MMHADISDELLVPVINEFLSFTGKLRGSVCCFVYDTPQEGTEARDRFAAIKDELKPEVLGFLMGGRVLAVYAKHDIARYMAERAALKPGTPAVPQEPIRFLVSGSGQIQCRLS